jgi:hypothetical protein
MLGGRLSKVLSQISVEVQPVEYSETRTVVTTSGSVESMNEVSRCVDPNHTEVSEALQLSVTWNDSPSERFYFISAFRPLLSDFGGRILESKYQYHCQLGAAGGGGEGGGKGLR